MMKYNAHVKKLHIQNHLNIDPYKNTYSKDGASPGKSDNLLFLIINPWGCLFLEQIQVVKRLDTRD